MWGEASTESCLTSPSDYSLPYCHSVSDTTFDLCDSRTAGNDGETRKGSKYTHAVNPCKQWTVDRRCTVMCAKLKLKNTTGYHVLLSYALLSLSPNNVPSPLCSLLSLSHTLDDFDYVLTFSHKVAFKMVLFHWHLRKSVTHVMVWRANGWKEYAFNHGCYNV